MKPAKLLTLVSILFLLISLVLGLKLISERQLINKKAAVSNGTLYMSLSGPTNTTVGQNLPILVNIANGSTPLDRGIVSITAYLSYPSNNSAVGLPTIQETLPSPWSYSFKDVSTNGTNTNIQIIAIYNQPGTNGYVPSGIFSLASINFPTLSTGSLTLSFDTNQSFIYSKDGAIDILNSSLAANTFTISGNSKPTNTPTTVPVATNTPVPTSVPGATNTPTPIPANVSIANMAFVPQNITVYIGDQVTWANNDSTSHTITSDSAVWDSGTVAPGHTFARTFNDVGTFPYHCAIHPTMTGVVTVVNRPSAEPNNCGGTCGSNSNCKGGLACFGGYCRNPLDPGSSDCTIRPATPVPTRRPTSASHTVAATATPYPTSIYAQDLTPTPEDTVIPGPDLTPTPAPPAGPSWISRVLIVGGMWLLVLLLIIWLIKKYRDSQTKDKTINDLVNRFKTPEPPTPPTPSNPPTV